jgi:hypothetical protein
MSKKTIQIVKKHFKKIKFYSLLSHSKEIKKELLNEKTKCKRKYYSIDMLRGMLLDFS